MAALLPTACGVENRARNVQAGMRLYFCRLREFDVGVDQQ